MGKKFIVTKSQLRRIIQKSRVAKASGTNEVTRVKALINANTGKLAGVQDLTGKISLPSAFSNNQVVWHWRLETQNPDYTIYVLKMIKDGKEQVVYYGSSEYETLKPTSKFTDVQEFVAAGDDDE